MVTYRDYMNVGIRELKAHLSEYVHRAQAGEQVTITDRGIPIAQLAPCRTDAGAVDSPEELRRGIAQGWIRARTHGGPLAPSHIGLTFAGGLSAAGLVSDDRDEP